MNAWKLCLGCAQGLISLVLAGCCCDPVAPRTSCGRSPMAHRQGHCGHSTGCGRAKPLAAHRPLLRFEQVCPYGFPPYNPPPLGFASGAPHFVEASLSRHVEMAPSVAKPSPAKAPAELPKVIDEHAKRLPADEAVEVPEKTPTATPEYKSPANLAQPGHAPRAVVPGEEGVDEHAEDAPLPDSAKQPVSVPAPADDLPPNPLRGSTDGKEPKADATPVKPEVKEPVVAPKPESADELPDAPEPKSADKDAVTGGSADKGDESDSGGDDEDWDDAPLPKNDLPSLAPPVR